MFNDDYPPNRDYTDAATVIRVLIVTLFKALAFITVWIFKTAFQIMGAYLRR